MRVTRGLPIAYDRLKCILYVPELLFINEILRVKPGVVLHVSNPTDRMPKQEHFKFEGIMDYTVRSWKKMKINKNIGERNKEKMVYRPTVNLARKH